MDDHLDPVASMTVPDDFTQVTALVMDFLNARPGAQQALFERARSEPEGVTLSLLALGAVLLDMAAGALHLAPEDVLDRVARGIAESH